MKSALEMLLGPIFYFIRVLFLYTDNSCELCRKHWDMEERKERDKGRLSESFVVGAVALAFLVIGYQTAVFVHQAAVTKIAADRDCPDTVFVYGTAAEIPAGEVSGLPGTVAYPSAAGMDATDGMAGNVAKREGRKTDETALMTRHDASHGLRVKAVRERMPRRRIESFRFDPNTVSVEDLCRLGFSAKQAQAIDNYRNKGGRFRRKEDFAKSFVVSDSIFRRLEPFIDIPLVDLNTADSAAFDALPGIGGWFAAKMVEHRDRLGGYSYKEQLLDIRNFDSDRYAGLSDLVEVAPEHIRPYPFWTLPADSLRKHPYVGNAETARAIVLFRENMPRASWTVEALAAAGILSSDAAAKLSRCVMEE